jgi:hypothetical protein
LEHHASQTHFLKDKPTSTLQSNCQNSQFLATIAFERSRLQKFKSNSQKSTLDIIDALRAQVSFYGIIKLQDQVSQHELEISNMRQQNTLIREVLFKMDKDVK